MKKELSVRYERQGGIKNPPFLFFPLDFKRYL